MTPAEEALFLALYHQGQTYRQMAATLGCALSTVAAWASALAAQGKITPRPRGGASPRRKALAGQEGTPAPVQRPVQTPVQTSAPVHKPVHTPSDHPATSPDLSGVLNALVERLSAIEETLKHGGVQTSTPVHDYAPVQHYALPGVEPPKLSPVARKSARWNIYMPRWIRQRIEQAAALEGISPSQFLQRLCGPWAATWQNPEAQP